MSQDNFDEIKAKVEALLFSYGDWISVTDMMHTLGLDSELLISNALKELEQKFKEGFSFGLESKEDNTWRMSLKPKYEDLVSDLITGTEIPTKALKVLSVIAYEQPITKTRLSEILGKAVKKEVEYLYRNKFLSYEKQGIGKYYRVTKKFYDYFKLDEDEDFRDAANKSITTFLEELPTPKPETSEEVKEE